MIPVYFLGPDNSYSHVVTKKLFTDKTYTLTACKTFSEVTKNILQNKESIGVLPIENSITSDIHENIDVLFRNKNLSIIREAFLQINLHLIGLENANLSDISSVYSHPRALLQCTQFIEKHNLQTIEVSSTAAGKEEIIKQQDKEKAVIGSSDLIVSGQTKILAENIGNDKLNFTRFACISQNRNIYQSEKNKISVIFKVPHVPGSLAKILTLLSGLSLNLTKIESRPIPGTSWEYYFWVDEEKENLDIHILEKTLQNATSEYRILGVYQKGEVLES